MLSSDGEEGIAERHDGNDKRYPPALVAWFGGSHVIDGGNARPSGLAGWLAS